MAKSIAFIDKRVANYLSIAGAFEGSGEVVFLEPDDDGVKQIADYLFGRSGVESLHLVSHGDEARISLGATDLSISTLPAHWKALENIGSSLSEDADILLYGCNVAAGPLGEEFLRRVGEATGADVAASNDVTGSRNAGGDAVLEETVGEVSAQPVLTQAQLDEWHVALASPDLVVFEIRPDATIVTKGSTFYYSYAIENIGNGEASSSRSGIYLDSKSNKLPGWDGYDLIDSISAGGSYPESNSFSTANLSPGTHTLWIKADDTGLIAESNEGNNWTSVTFTVVEPPRPDLVVSSITPNATTVTQGSTFSYAYVIGNSGGGAASSSYSGIYLTSQFNMLPGWDGYDLIGSISAGGSYPDSNSFSTARALKPGSAPSPCRQGPRTRTT